MGSGFYRIKAQRVLINGKGFHHGSGNGFYGASLIFQTTEVFGFG